MASEKRFNFGRAGTLFNRKTINRALTKVHLDASGQQLEAARDWAAQVRHPNFQKAKETSVRGEFIQKVLVTILGYTPYRAGETYTVATEEALGKGAVDTALGTFRDSERAILAPFELKGPGTDDLDAIMPGRNKSPVQQAWEYAIDAPGRSRPHVLFRRRMAPAASPISAHRTASQSSPRACRNGGRSTSNPSRPRSEKPSRPIFR